MSGQLPCHGRLSGALDEETPPVDRAVQAGQGRRPSGTLRTNGLPAGKRRGVIGVADFAGARCPDCGQTVKSVAAHPKGWYWRCGDGSYHSHAWHQNGTPYENTRGSLVSGWGQPASRKRPPAPRKRFSRAVTVAFLVVLLLAIIVLQYG